MEAIFKIIETISECISRVACKCHSHCCDDCFDISVDVIQKHTELLERQITTNHENTE